MIAINGPAGQEDNGTAPGFPSGFKEVPGPIDIQSGEPLRVIAFTASELAGRMDQRTVNKGVGGRKLRIPVCQIIRAKACLKAFNRTPAQNRDLATIVKQPLENEPANCTAGACQKNMHQDACFEAHS
jgi:hypothetical protein